MKDKLAEGARAAAIQELQQSGWAEVAGRDAITKSFKHKNFVEAFGWMTKVAIWSEKWNHHPEWANTYGTVDVTLTSHDVDGLSQRDLQLAKKMDRLFEG